MDYPKRLSQTYSILPSMPISSLKVTATYLERRNCLKERQTRLISPPVTKGTVNHLSNKLWMRRFELLRTNGFLLNLAGFGFGGGKLLCHFF